PFHGPVGRGEQVVVPAGGAYSGAVAAGGGEPSVGPRDPGGGDPGLGQAAQQAGVGGGGGQFQQGGHVPGAADHGDPFVPGAQGGAQHLAHVRLAAGLVLGLRFGGEFGADRGHGLGDGGERGGAAVAALLHHVVPPAFGVVVAGGLGEDAERVDAHARRLPLPGLLLFFGARGQGVGGGQVAEAHLGAVLGGVAQRLPLRGEDRER